MDRKMKLSGAVSLMVFLLVAIAFLSACGKSTPEITGICNLSDLNSPYLRTWETTEGILTYRHMRDAEVLQSCDLSDDRLDGDIYVVYFYDYPGASGPAGHGVGLTTLKDPEGNILWEGGAYIETDEHGNERDVAILNGKGKYEGLRATMDFTKTAPEVYSVTASIVELVSK